ncbi:PREDICTED: uncharacterized protein LOC105570768 [Vollenhovia emeryi]|uniref:uncharacterized protein LOC105570768 n=1 Tax=Vollenhovia emeryi TaxID=411798 RepID=UPI0005F582E9|nr:PREDICTED: uncharacterized protein LOC105570768 [Vollenhovia emeryi]
MQKTQLGWIISGEMHGGTSSTACFVASNDALQRQLETFWKIEEGVDNHMYSLEEQACEDNFMKNTTYGNDDRYSVHLPFKREPKDLGDSYTGALRRLQAMENKFAKNKLLKEQYVAFMREYETLGHMVQIKDHENSFGDVHYLPHHAVYKQSSTTTKLRVVFDASCKTSTGLSLNDILMVGPTIQQDLFAILIRFRQYPYVITADIRQMYRQIYVTDKHQDLQRILWREDPSQPIKIFKLRTVTYGMAASPFLAIRCLHQAAKEGEMEFPEASQIIRRDFYVDDMITGANTVEHIQRIKDEVTAVLQSVGFPLHKWVSNTSITSAEDSDGTTDFTHRIGEEMKTLGILWNHRDDNLQYNTKPPSISGRVTKRCILSTVSQIFDPLGLVAPIIVTAKILLQELWQLKLGWVEAVPLHVHTRWLHYVKHLSYIRDIAIPRLTVITNPVRVEINAFCDASEVAYGACVYIRSEDALNNCSSRLLCAKSRVAPLSKISLPRLELCGALLLARLHRRVVEALTINIQTHYYWCDSTITLAWIAGDPQTSI